MYTSELPARDPEDVSPSADGFSNDSAAVESVKETIAQEVAVCLEDAQRMPFLDNCRPFHIFPPWCDFSFPPSMNIT